MTFSSFYLAPVSYYSALCHADEALLEVYDNYTKQTFRNRCVIDSPQGALPLTIPIVKPEGSRLMKDIRISDHGKWRHQHWNALQSSYRQSPFFEYYADDFAPFYEKKWEFLVDFNEDLLRLVCSLIDIDTPIRRAPFPTSPQGRGTWGNGSRGQQSSSPLGEARERGSYYQVFAQKHGFIADLSIVDLLFNMGPESLLLL